MIAEAGFFLSIAGLSGSLAGLAGLVAGLRRGSVLAALEAFRLRQIVEFSFATVVMAISVIPLAALVADVAVAARAVGALALAYLVLTLVLLIRRGRETGVWLIGRQRPAVGAIVVASTALSIAVVVCGDVALLELLFVALLVRPMTVFLFVLGALRGDADRAFDAEPAP